MTRVRDLYPGLRAGPDLRTGFAGWLVVFVLTRLWMAGCTAYQLWRSGAALGVISRGGAPGDSAAAVADQAIAFAFVFSGTLYGLWLVGKLAPEARRFWSVFLPANIAAVLLVRLCGTYRYGLIHDVQQGWMSGQTTRALWAVVAQPLAWTAYWIRSRRVRATFPTEPTPNNSSKLVDARTSPRHP